VRNLCAAATERFLSRSLAPIFLAPLFLVILALSMVVPQQMTAQRPQLKRPNDDTEDKPPVPKKPVKKVKGPRAVALMQTLNGKTTLIPIAILVEGKFYDASEYKADPVPMALDSGNIYEVEQTGTSQGLFTVSSALHSKATNAPHPWIGAGSFLPNGSEAAKTTRKAEDVPRGLRDNGDDAPPRLTRANSTSDSNPNSGAAPRDAAAASAKPSTDPNASDKPAASSGGASDKSPSSTGPGSASTPTPASSKSTTDTAGKSDGSTPANQPNPQEKNPPQDANYYRPTLRRGKPTQTVPTEDDDTATPPPSTDAKANASGTNSSATNTAETKKLTPVQLTPAISDDGGPDPRSYKFYWKTGEEEDRRKQMLALAADEVRAYVTALVKNSISAAPAPKTAVARKSAAKPVQPEFENVRFQGFDVWSNNQPVMILTAEVHMPAPSGSPAVPDSYTITLVTRTDIYGNLHKMYSGVTDKFHLDVTPQLQLIDAVDADGDGRGELLFTETTDAGSGYVIYRATADRLWKLFDSLGGS
jgi:hypothetical protein